MGSIPSRCSHPTLSPQKQESRVRSGYVICSFNPFDPQILGERKRELGDTPNPGSILLNHFVVSVPRRREFRCLVHVSGVAVNPLGPHS
jgi:hypothetical protein